MERHTRIGLTLAVAVGVMATAARAQQYTYTKIADSRNFGATSSFMTEQWKINDSGLVAFTSTDPILPGPRLISVGSGGPTTPITNPTGLFNFDPNMGSFDLLDDGTVFFSIEVGGAGGAGQPNAVFSSSDGIHFQTRVVGVDDPINPGNGERFGGLFAMPDGTLTYIKSEAAITSAIRRFEPFSTSPSIPSGATGASIVGPYGLAYDLLNFSASPFSDPNTLGMNSNGTVAFRNGGAAPSGVIASTDGSGAFTILATDASDPSGGAPTGPPRHQPFNDLAQTVYTRNVMDPNTGDFWEIVVTDGTSPTVVADTLGILDFSASSPNPALNNS
ncbi:MAG: hypothetical protein CMJ49_10375 [Planctomycetaceae bacterium]|nr:hypothetical protein [Planctomycetaceae bacterium]